MKKLIFLLLLIPIAAYAVESSLVGGNRPIQAFAPDGTQVVSLTVNSSTTDLSSNAQYSFYSASGTCFLRLMPTSAKSTYTKVPMPNTTWITYAKNPATPFANLSGCVGGYLQRQ